MSSKRVLVVDAVGARRRLHVFGLRCAGFIADEAVDLTDALARIGSDYPDLVLIVAASLDTRVHGIVHALRSGAYTKELPVLALVEHDLESATRYALSWGIDDYLCNPIAPEVFIERVRAALTCRASQKPVKSGSSALVLDETSGVVRCGDREIALYPTERRLLEVLLAHPGETMPRDLLLFRLWGTKSDLQSRVLDVSVCRLRRAFKKLGCKDVLETVRQHGYRLVLTALAPDEHSAQRAPTAARARRGSEAPRA